jgi:hypothetical protein
VHDRGIATERYEQVAQIAVWLRLTARNEAEQHRQPLAQRSVEPLQQLPIAARDCLGNGQIGVAP